jgi:hypothetical protein
MREARGKRQEVRGETHTVLSLRGNAELAFESNGLGVGRNMVCDEDLIGLRVHTLDGTHVVVIVTHLARHQGVTRVLHKEDSI